MFGIKYIPYHKTDHVFSCRQLQRYRLPSAFAARFPERPKHLSPVFLDQTDLVAHETSLSLSLQSRLEASNYLIVLCSPHSATSPWVNAEVEWFLSHGRKDRIIPVILSGTPHAEDPARECYPPSLASLPAEAMTLFRNADPSRSAASWAVRFAASLPGVMLVLSGMSNMAQMRDNISFMKDFVPLSEEEKRMCLKAGGIVNSGTAIPCTGCSYCTEGCPMHIAIPKYFSLYNEDMRENLDEKGWTINFTNYEKLTAEYGKAGDCIGCGQCESVCPQHLPIIDNLKETAAHFED